jgi:hypothetical protein
MKRALAAIALWSLVTIGWQPAGTGAGPAPAEGRFTVPASFQVELAVRPPDGDNFSLINCCFDDQGRLLVSKEKGPILLCTGPGKDGVLKDIKTYCDKVQNCQGMSWIRDALWLVGDGPSGTGLYRCRDTKNADQIDEVALAHAFKGGMGEEGPHGVIHGPDGLIYCVLGNRAWAQIGGEIAKNGANPNKLAANSPLTRWPTGGVGPEPGKGKRRAPQTDLPTAPGGTIWRMDHEGKNLGLVASGFRNAFDAAFAPNGELFTFDGDPVSEQDLPWFRPARICHCPPGADFVWRAGAANTPDYYIDSLPPIAETGRGTPFALEFYDHVVYPKEYQGAYFMADGLAGVIYAVHLQRDGASYRSKVERFCQGTTMPVTDLCVGPDGAVYFVMAGLKSQGGVYRIVYKDAKATVPAGAGNLAEWPQPLAAWSQKKLAAVAPSPGKAAAPKYVWEQFLNDAKISAADRIRITAAFQQLGHRPEFAQIAPLLSDKEAELRAHAVWLIGVNGFGKAAPDLFQALADSDALVRRRACEALLRIGVEPPIAKLWPLLSEKDRFVRSAARLLLERIDPEKWVARVWTQPKSYKEINETDIWNGIVALCHTGQATQYVEEVFGRLHGNQTNPSQGAVKYPLNLLEWLRATELALAHCERRPIWTRYIAKQCDDLFPHQDQRVNRELAILLAQFQREGYLEKPIQGRLLKAMGAQKDERLQQVHYAHCMRSLRTGWTPESVKAITVWYDGTRIWTRANSQVLFLESIYKESCDGFAIAEKQSILEQAEKVPLAATALARRLQVVIEPALVPALQNLASRLKTATGIPGQAELTAAVSDAIAAGSR